MAASMPDPPTGVDSEPPGAESAAATAVAASAGSSADEFTYDYASSELAGPCSPTGPQPLAMQRDDMPKKPLIELVAQGRKDARSRLKKGAEPGGGGAGDKKQKTKSTTVKRVKIANTDGRGHRYDEELHGSDSSETCDDEHLFFSGRGAGICNWSRYRLGSKTIRIDSWRCCGRRIQTLETDNVLDVNMFQNCLHRRRDRGVLIISSHDPTTPLVRVKIDNAMHVFLRLREYCASNCSESVLDAIRNEDLGGPKLFEEDEGAVVKGEFFACCWGRGCCCTKCAACDCCESVERYSVNDVYIRLERKTCCYSRYGAVFLDWAYDLDLKRRCVCCCTRSCEHGMITAYSFDAETPQLTIRVKGNPQTLFDEISQRLNVKQATRDHFLRARTQRIIDAAFQPVGRTADGRRAEQGSGRGAQQ